MPDEIIVQRYNRETGQWEVAARELASWEHWPWTWLYRLRKLLRGAL